MSDDNHEVDALEDGSTYPASMGFRWRLLIVDDCLLRREHLVDELQRRGAEVTQCWDVDSFHAATREQCADVVLINAGTRHAGLVLREIVAAGIAPRVVVFGLSDDDDIVSYAELGIVGYHLRDESLADLMSFINRVAAGGSGCSSRVSGLLLRRLSQLATEFPDDPDPDLLTQREAEILKLLELGLSNQAIARRLHIATHTVKNHVHNILGKLGARSRAEAAAMARNSQALSRLSDSGINSE